MRDYIDERVIEVARYITENSETVRNTAAHFGVSKSTVHKDITVKLCRMDKILYEKVRRVLDTNKAQRHIRGGLATREKYSVLKSRKLKTEE